jgi:hypothetical protein
VAFETVNDRRPELQPDGRHCDALSRRGLAVIKPSYSFVPLLATLIAIRIGAWLVAIALALFVVAAERRSLYIQIIVQSFILSLFLISIRKAGFIAL